MRNISEAEKQVMEIIWNASKAVTAAEIVGLLQNGWKKNTVLTFLSRLAKKGLLAVQKVGNENYYAAAASEQEYLDFETTRFVQNVHKGSMMGFVTSLCDNGKLTKKDIEELLKHIEK